MGLEHTSGIHDNFKQKGSLETAVTSISDDYLCIGFQFDHNTSEITCPASNHNCPNSSRFEFCPFSEVPYYR